MGQAFKNWALVWIGNLLGGALVAYLVSLSGVFDWSNGLYGGVIVKTSMGKLGFTWVAAIASGILCNWIVCATVWMTYGAKDVTGKVLTWILWLYSYSYVLDLNTVLQTWHTYSLDYLVKQTLHI